MRTKLILMLYLGIQDTKITSYISVLIKNEQGIHPSKILQDICICACAAHVQHVQDVNGSCWLSCRCQWQGKFNQGRRCRVGCCNGIDI